MNVYKAGLIPIRYSGDNCMVAIVYRDQYKDFTFPKGKQEQEEHVLYTAYRELLEETGIKSKIGPYLGSTSWSLKNNIETAESKYWIGVGEQFKKEDEGKRFEMNNEITYYSWYSLAQSRKVLTYKNDIKLVDEIENVLKLKMKPVLILLRHAEAEPKMELEESDLERKLTQIGKSNTKEIAKLFSLYPITSDWKLISSPARRCFDTLLYFKNLYMKESEILTDDNYSQFLFDEKSVFPKIDEILSGDNGHIICTHRPCIGKIVSYIAKKYKQSLNNKHTNSFTEHYPHMVENLSTSSYIVIYKSTALSGDKKFFSESILL